VPDATFSYFAIIRILQVMGLPFLFIPVNTIAYDGLPQTKTAEGSALMNVARNLGGGFGVSLANTLLLQRSQFHQARLVENVTPTSPVFQSTMKHMSDYFIHQGAAPTTAQAHAYGLIGRTIMSQASLLAYIDVFYTWAIFAAVMVPIVLLTVRRVSGSAHGAAMH
jgi:DHA2 family multidrug resistance protein